METNEPNPIKFAKSVAEIVAKVNKYKKPFPDLANFLRIKPLMVILKQCYKTFKNFSEFCAPYQRNIAFFNPLTPI